MGLLNISCQEPTNAPGQTTNISERECSKKSVQQGRSPFDARSVLSVRERERREERQVCEPEGSANGRERRWRLFSTFPQWESEGLADPSCVSDFDIRASDLGYGASALSTKNGSE